LEEDNLERDQDQVLVIENQNTIKIREQLELFIKKKTQYINLLNSGQVKDPVKAAAIES
jgi:hypothetical protein